MFTVEVLRVGNLIASSAYPVRPTHDFVDPAVMYSDNGQRSRCALRPPSLRVQGLHEGTCACIGGCVFMWYAVRYDGGQGVYCVKRKRAIRGLLSTARFGVMIAAYCVVRLCTSMYYVSYLETTKQKIYFAALVMVNVDWAKQKYIYNRCTVD